MSSSSSSASCRQYLLSWKGGLILLFLTLLSCAVIVSVILVPSSSSESTFPTTESSGDVDNSDDDDAFFPLLPALPVGGNVTNTTSSGQYPMIQDDRCQFLEDDIELCLVMDESIQEQAEHVREQSQQDHQPLKTLVVLVRWTNHRDKNLIPVEHIQKLWNADDIDSTLYPSGSLKRYIQENSYGTFDIDATVIDYIETDNSDWYYADGRYGFDTQFDHGRPELRHALYYVLDQLEGQGGIDWTEYDHDNDGILDSVIFMHSGYDAANHQPDCNFPGKTPQDRIWSHATSDLWRTDAWTSATTGIQLGSYAITSVFRGSCDANIVRIGILGHEFLHTLGLPDLYDANGPYNGNYQGVGGLGSYDIMSNPSGHDHRPKFPSTLSPWSKYELGWIEPIEITDGGTYIARPSNLHPDIFIIKRRYENGEYLLIENRQPISFDQRMRGGGILIYHIDTTTSTNGKIRSNGNRGFPGQNGWPSNGKHYPVALLQADGLYQIEKALQNQDPDDFYRFNNHELSPGVGTSNYPNSDSYARGFIRPTGITIDHFQEIDASGTYSFRVAFEEDYSVEPSSSPTTAPTQSPTSEGDVCLQIFELELKTDSFARETSWELLEISTGQTILAHLDDGTHNNRLQNDRIYEEWLCLPNADRDYEFIIYDSYGDGLCEGSRGCKGWWKLWLNDELVGEGDGNFQFSAKTIFETTTVAI